jgi:hypothetical protein
MHMAKQAQSLRDSLLQTASVGHFDIIGMAYDRRVIPLSRSTHVRGWHPVRRGHGAIAFESGIECSVISALAGYEQLLSIRSQPVSVEYRYEGRIRQYTPDFLVHLSDVPDRLAALGFGFRTFLEVKPLLRAAADQDKLRRQFAVLREAANCTVLLLTEHDREALQRETSHDH